MWPVVIALRVAASQAWGSTVLSLQVPISEAIIAQFLPRHAHAY
jgi:hypothetical protein